MPAPLVYPKINGVVFDHSSVELNILNVLFYGVKSISYSHKLTPGKAKGNRAQVVGRTRGPYEAEGELELYRAEFDAMCLLLSSRGKGIMEYSIPVISVSFSENLIDVSQDKLIGVRLTSNEFTSTEGESPLTVKCKLDIMQLLPNGLPPIDPNRFLIGG